MFVNSKQTNTNSKDYLVGKNNGLHACFKDY